MEEEIKLSLTIEQARILVEALRYTHWTTNNHRTKAITLEIIQMMPKKATE